jgi:hypothetical protein
MSLPTSPDRYIIVITSNSDFRGWREAAPLDHCDQVFDESTWATWEECHAAIEKLWQRRRKFSTGREYSCWGSFCRCTSYRPGYCCAACEFQASVENDPDRPTLQPECLCDHSMCGTAVEMSDPREAVEKLKAALNVDETVPTENESFWGKIKRTWAETRQ